MIRDNPARGALLVTGAALMFASMGLLIRFASQSFVEWIAWNDVREIMTCIGKCHDSSVWIDESCKERHGREAVASFA